MIIRNRKAKNLIVAYGEVAIPQKNVACSIFIIVVVIAMGSLQGYAISFIACYVPPEYLTARPPKYMEDILIEIKRKYCDLFIVLKAIFISGTMLV